MADRTGDPELGEKVEGGWGPFLKPASFRGDLCFADPVGRNVCFAHPDDWLGAVTPVETGTAIAEITRRYLGAYGPATREDLGRWWAVSPARAGRLLDGLGEEVVVVDLEGRPSHLHAAHLGDLRAAGPRRIARLLPAFDPYVAGSPREGLGIFPGERRAEIYRPAGWLTPVVVLDGVIAGVFSQDRAGDRLDLQVRPFAPLPGWAGDAIAAEAERLAAWLGAGDYSVIVT